MRTIYNAEKHEKIHKNVHSLVHHILPHIKIDVGFESVKRKQYLIS